MDNYLVYTRPILLSQLWERDGYTLFPIVLYTTIAIAMMACSVIISNKRAQERIGDSVVFPYIKNTLVFILSVCGLLLMGYIFFSMFKTTPAMYIGAAIGFSIAYCIAQMIAEKKLNILNKMKDFTKFGAVTVGILLLMIVSTRSDIFGYERHVPHFGDIEGVQMLDVSILSRDLGKSPNAALNELLVKDTEIINETLALHQAIINERQSLRQFHTERRQFNAIFRGGRFLMADVNYRFSVLYKLKNGNLIVRSYYLPESFMDENNVQELRTRSGLSIPLLQNRPYLIDGIQLTFYDPDHSEIVISKHYHIQEFISAFMKDNDLIQPIRFASDGILVRFRSEALDLGDYTWMNSLSFEIAYSEHSYVRDWLVENGYFNAENPVDI